jgi:hypothetical protein
MVRTSTWFVLGLLLALVGLSLFLQDRKDRELATPTATASMAPLFKGAAKQPSAIRIENAAGDAVEFARSADGTWRLSAPSNTEADQAAAQAAATQISALRSLSVVSLSPAVVGLDAPSFTVTITFDGESTPHRLRVGSPTPIQDGYYAQLDDGVFQVVDKYGLDELIGLLKAPPFLATPTPMASAAPPAVPTPITAESTATGVPATATVAP